MIKARIQGFELMAWLVVSGLVISAQPAHAYIDPGTGSFLFQLLIGTGLAMLATVRVWWGKVVSLVKPKPKS